MLEQQGTESSGEMAAARWQALRPALEGFVHDARNPLHALMLQLEIFRGAPGVPARRAEEMRAQLERLRRLLDALGEAALPDTAGTPSPDLEGRVARALELLRWTAQRRRVTFRVQLARGAAVDCADGEALEFLVGQVAWHALGSCPDGAVLEVVLHAEMGAVELRAEAVGARQGAWQRAPFSAVAERHGGEAQVRGVGARLRLPAARRAL